MLHLGIVLLFVWMVSAAQAAKLDSNDSAPKVNLLTTQLAYADTQFLPPFRLGASVVLTHSKGAMPLELDEGTPQFMKIAKPQHELALATNFTWQTTNDSERTSMLHLFRGEFKEQQVNFTFRPHSIFIDRSGLKLTLLQHSALIESGAFKIRLQAHLTSIVWDKAF